MLGGLGCTRKQGVVGLFKRNVACGESVGYDRLADDCIAYLQVEGVLEGSGAMVDAEVAVMERVTMVATVTRRRTVACPFWLRLFAAVRCSPSSNLRMLPMHKG
eukprot:3058424-Pyramimonas_sp.AAC.1